MEDVVVGYYCVLDLVMLIKVWVILFVVLVYFVLLFDMILDFIIGVGFGDDVIILMVVIVMICSYMWDDYY